MSWVIGILTAVAGTVGFSLLFRIDLRRLPFAALGGGLSWAVYLLLLEFTASIFVSTLAAAFIATVYSEIFAHICRTPATVFLIPCLIPLVPGGSLYYTMRGLLTDDYTAAAQYGIATAEVMLGISGGVVAASLMVYAYRSLVKKYKA